MALRHAVLAALLEGEASGYELAKRFDISIANFWYAQPQQLYSELARLEDAGFVEGRLVLQEKRPNKRVYRLTPGGRAELARYAGSTPKPTAIKDELLVMVQAVDAAAQEDVVTALEVRAAQTEAKLRRFEALAEGLLAGRDEETFLRESPRVGPYLTLALGRAFMAEHTAWCRWAAGVLRDRGAVVSPPRPVRP
jgi:DNA-binding PadR family transcriptional regulator